MKRLITVTATVELEVPEGKNITPEIEAKWMRYAGGWLLGELISNGCKGRFKEVARNYQLPKTPVPAGSHRSTTMRISIDEIGALEQVESA